MVEEALSLEKVLSNIDRGQATQLRSEMLKLLNTTREKERSMKASFDQIRTIEDLDKYERGRVDIIQIPISETTSYIESNIEPEQRDDEFEPMPPDIPAIPILPTLTENYKMQQI